MTQISQTKAKLTFVHICYGERKDIHYESWIQGVSHNVTAVYSNGWKVILT